jgi:hypothetical protein
MSLHLQNYIFYLAVFFDRVYVAHVFILLDQDVKPSCE